VKAEIEEEMGRWELPGARKRRSSPVRLMLAALDLVGCAAALMAALARPVAVADSYRAALARARKKRKERCCKRKKR